MTGDFYPQGATAETVLEYAGRQIASPVQFVKGLQTLYAAGARVFVEVGPKKALHGFVEDVLGSEHDDVVALFTNHPKVGDDVAFNQALCGLYAAGIGLDRHETPEVPVGSPWPATRGRATPAPRAADRRPCTQTASGPDSPADATIRELGLLFADVLEKGMHLYAGTGAAGAADQLPPPAPTPAPEPAPAGGSAAPSSPWSSPVRPSGCPAPSRPSTTTTSPRSSPVRTSSRVLGDDTRRRMVDMRITRLVKDATSGGGSFATIDDPQDVIKLAGVHAPLDVVEQFGVDKARDEALDTTTRLAIGAGFDAMRDAGIPLVMSYKTTTLGTQLPDRWGLPEALRDETGVIFASAFPGYDRFAEAVEGYALDRGRREGLLAVEGLRARMSDDDPATAEVEALVRRAARDPRARALPVRPALPLPGPVDGPLPVRRDHRGARPEHPGQRRVREHHPGHSRWPRTGSARAGAAGSSSSSADDATGEHLLPWVTAGFLASGAAATDERVEDAATPFDRRRHGMIVGAGAAAFVVESADAARERGIQPIAEALATVTANSAFHGSRLDVQHICDVMEALVSEAEGRGVDRREIAAAARCSSRTRPTPRPAAAAPRRRSTRCAGSSGRRPTRSSSRTPRASPGTPWAPASRTSWRSRRSRPASSRRSPTTRSPTPTSARSTSPPGGSTPWSTRCASLPASGPRSPCRCCAGPRSPTAGAARRVSSATPTGSSTRTPGSGGSTGSPVTPAAGSRSTTGACASSTPARPPSPVERSGHVPVPYADRLAPTRGFALRRRDPAATAAPAPASAAGAPHRHPSPVEPGAAAAPRWSRVRATPEPSAPAGDDVLAVVTGIVAEMTGYPADLLDPDLDLEADLGVDTVKQAEVFAAVRERWSLERDDTLRLRDFPTLNHVAGWVRGKLGVTAVTSPASASPVLSPSPRPFGEGDDPILATVTQIVAEMTGYPADLLGARPRPRGRPRRRHRQAGRGLRRRPRPVGPRARRHRAAARVPDAEPRRGLGPQPARRARARRWFRPCGRRVRPRPCTGARAVGRDARSRRRRDRRATRSSTPSPAIVAEMTGYPADLLDPDLDLEADLGVDTVKQAEVFAAVRAQWNLERDDTLQLREFPTLNHVAGWVRGKLGVPEPVRHPGRTGTGAPLPRPRRPPRPAAATRGRRRSSTPSPASSPR